jgi:hypothetical protein
MSAEKITVKKITTEYLIAHGYDGLCYKDCGCPINDLMPCDTVSCYCVPGHKKLQNDGDWIIKKD